MKNVRYTKSAIRTLRQMPANTATRIRSKIEAYAANPDAQENNAKKLKGRNAIRMRVGDWRVIMDDHNRVLDVLEIGARGSVYD